MSAVVHVDLGAGQRDIYCSMRPIIINSVHVSPFPDIGNPLTRTTCAKLVHEEVSTGFSDVSYLT